jgi:hypothetical protein
MRRILAVTVALSITTIAPALAGAGPALANNDPHRVFLPGAPLDLPAGFCSFPTHYDVVADKEYGKFTTLADGTVVLHETGSFKVRATNVDSGASVLLNASGPGTITFPPDGTTHVAGNGHWLITNLAADAAPFGLPGVMLTSGVLHETLDASFTPTALSVTGHVTDVCAALS